MGVVYFFALFKHYLLMQEIMKLMSGLHFFMQCLIQYVSELERYSQTGSPFNKIAPHSVPMGCNDSGVGNK